MLQVIDVSLNFGSRKLFDEVNLDYLSQGYIFARKNKEYYLKLCEKWGIIIFVSAKNSAWKISLFLFYFAIWFSRSSLIRSASTLSSVSAPTGRRSAWMSV